MIPRQRFRVMGMAQAVYYTAGGAWPILHMKSFEKVTGPKTDHWLVKTVGGLLAVTGLVLGRAALRKEGEEGSFDLALIGAGEAGALAAVALVYVAEDRISPVYVLDAAAQLAIVAGWASLLPALARPAEDGGNGGGSPASS
jgi:hypothetical protein